MRRLIEALYTPVNERRMETQQLLEAAQTIQVIQSLLNDEQNEWLPVIAAIGGAFIGGISTFFPS